MSWHESEKQDDLPDVSQEEKARMLMEKLYHGGETGITTYPDDDISKGVKLTSDDIADAFSFVVKVMKNTKAAGPALVVMDRKSIDAVLRHYAQLLMVVQQMQFLTGWHIAPCAHCGKHVGLASGNNALPHPLAFTEDDDDDND